MRVIEIRKAGDGKPNVFIEAGKGEINKHSGMNHTELQCCGHPKKYHPLKLCFFQESMLENGLQIQWGLI